MARTLVELSIGSKVLWQWKKRLAIATIVLTTCQKIFVKAPRCDLALFILLLD